MDQSVMEVLILAAIALFVLSRLYVALGRGEGSRPVRRPSAAPSKDESATSSRVQESPLSHADRPVFTGPAAAGLEEVYQADKSFAVPPFMQGARSAYQMIVAAYARGDRDTLRPLLDDDVYEAWDAAITRREETKEATFELLRIKRAEIETAGVEDGIARIAVRYEAELGDGEQVRTAREIWTFMRDVSRTDPNWILDDVEVAH